VRSYPRLKRRDSLARHAPGDAVRPTEPAVLAKLQAFVAELSRRKEIDVVAFTDGYTDIQVFFDERLLLPPLGYAVPDRLAAVKAGRNDPVDVALSGSPYRVSFTPKSPGANITADRSEVAGANSTPATRPGDDLLATLLDRVRSTRKDMKTWLVDGSGPVWYGPKTAVLSDRPRPDVSIPTSSDAPGGTRLMSIPPHDAHWTEDTPDVERRFPAIVWSMMAFSRPDAFEGMKDARYQVVVLDFRTCPEDITDALKWVLLPKQVPR